MIDETELDTKNELLLKTSKRAGSDEAQIKSLPHYIEEGNM